MANIVVPITSITKAAGAACSFFALIDAPTVNAGGLRDPEVSTQSDIVFKDVVFAYPTRPKTKVLDGLNVTFEKGKLTAIVGPSGSGKSTVVGLIERVSKISVLQPSRQGNLVHHAAFFGFTTKVSFLGVL